MTTSDCFKYEFGNNANTDLLNIFTNNKDTVNQILPFGLHINGGVSICVTKCGHTLNNCDDIGIETVINYGKVLVMTPKNKNSELVLHYDARNENANPDGSGTYKLKFICFTCPSTIKIGDIDSDMQSYLIYTNDQGLYAVICTLYRDNQPYDNLANSLLTGLLNNNIPSIGDRISGSSLGVNSMNISDFFPQDNLDYYEYVNTEKLNSNEIKSKILVKVFSKKVNIGSAAINNLKDKLFNSSSNCKFVNFNESLISTFNNKPENLNIFYVPDTGNSKICSTKEKMANIEKDVMVEEGADEEIVEEEVSLVERLSKANYNDKNKEDYINFDDSTKIYAINKTDGSIKRIGSGNDQVDEVYNNINELLMKNQEYSEDEIKKAVKEFPNYIYQNCYWRLDYKIRLYKVIEENDNNLSSSFDITEVDTIKDAVNKIGKTNDKDVFYAMKNFPNYPINDYYVSYYYKKKGSETSYLVIMYLILCTLILVFNYIFYRIIFYATNKDFGDISIADDEIKLDDRLKQLASWRILVNIILILQIISTVVFCVLKLSDLSHGSAPFSNVFIILTILSLLSTLFYGTFRLNYNDEKVSYAESKSLQVYLESSDDNDDNDKKVQYMKNLLNLLNFSNLFYSEEQDELDDIYKKLKELRDEALDSANKVKNPQTYDKLMENTDKTLERLQKYIDTNNINNNKTKSRAYKSLEKISKLLHDKTIGKISEKTSLGNRGEARKNATNIIQKLKKIIGSESNSDNNQQGGDKNNITLPFVTAPIRKNLNDDNSYETNKVLDGKNYWPDGHYINEEDESFEKSVWWDNLMEAVTMRYILMIIIFLLLVIFLINKVTDMIKTFDTSENRLYYNKSLILKSIIYLFYFGIFGGSILSKLVELYNYYLVPEKKEHIENTDENKSKKIQYILLGACIFIWIILVYFIFDKDKYMNWWIICTSIFLGGLIYIIFKACPEYIYTFNTRVIISILYLIIFGIIPYINKNENYLTFTLAFSPVILTLVFYMICGKDEEKKNIDVSEPFMLPNNNNFSDNNNINKVKDQDPLLIPINENLKELKEALNNLNTKGGNLKKKRENLSKHRKNLIDLSEYFKLKTDQKNKDLVDKIIQEIDDLSQ